MSTLMRNLNRLNVTATSPDGQIKVSLDYKDRLSVGVRDDKAFGGYDATRLAHQLGAVLCTAREGLRRGVRQAYEAAGYTVENAGKPHWDARQRRLQEAVAETVVTGKSRQGLVLIRASGARDKYRVKVHPKALEQLSREQFTLEVRSAHAKLLEEARVERNQLRRSMLPS